MKTRTAFMGSLLIFVAGIILLIIHSFDVFSALIISLGIIFIVPGIINITTISTTKRNDGESKKAKTPSRFQAMTSLISGVGSVIFGVVMIGWSFMFIKFLPVIFGIMLILGGCFHICAMALAFKPIRLPAWLYIMPVLLIIMGLSILFINKLDLLPHHIVMMTGIGLMIFAINVWFELWFIRKINSIQKPSHDSSTIDIEAQ